MNPGQPRVRGRSGGDGAAERRVSRIGQSGGVWPSGQRRERIDKPHGDYKYRKKYEAEQRTFQNMPCCSRPSSGSPMGVAHRAAIPQGGCRASIPDPPYALIVRLLSMRTISMILYGPLRDARTALVNSAMSPFGARLHRVRALSI